MTDEGFTLSSTFFFSPESIAIFPFNSLSVPFGAFVFLYDEKTEQDISGLSIVIRQIISLTTEKLDKLTLLEELKDLNASFEIKLRERTHELTEKNSRLEKELKLLNHPSNKGDIIRDPEHIQSKTESSLLKNISHEIRTPLNGILGFADIMRKTEMDSAERNKYINIIKMCGKSILKIFDDVIDLSNIESNQVKIIREDFPLGKFMNDLYDYYKNDELYQQRENVEIKLTMNLEGNTVVYSDRKIVWQVLMHLVGNALKFTNKGFVELGCKIHTSEPPKKGLHDLLFFIRDTGVGIDKSVQHLIFDRFFKVEHEISRLCGGTGLGLSIARDLAVMLEGKIWFDSEPEAGSQFYFLLPASAQVLIGKDKPLSSRELKARYNWPGKRALIVEDDEMSFVYLKEVLKATQIDILHARNGRQAIELFEANPDISLVLMDIKLPEMDGYEATKQIKQIRPSIPIIAQTAYAMADDQQKIINVGCDDYISKPINRRKLLQAIESLMI
jgi:signal transduction histidine kinase/CheY-like chemotaxis protein